mmetsp:Transcript_11151/g.68671  ORF Transcript_11151/g.68671 Transcript_11151/m.68671 type:complete len:496 (+) Transcript_11151:455-1942(+)
MGSASRASREPRRRAEASGRGRETSERCDASARGRRRTHGHGNVDARLNVRARTCSTSSSLASLAPGNVQVRLRRTRLPLRVVEEEETCVHVHVLDACSTTEADQAEPDVPRRVGTYVKDVAMLRAQMKACARAWTRGSRCLCSEARPKRADGESEEKKAGMDGRAWAYVELARLHRPSGALLLLWPCLYGASMATQAGHVPDGRVVAALVVGATLMRGSGCAVNDATDVDVDRLVTRTKSRPVARGTIAPRQAWYAAAAMAGVAGVSTCLLAPAALLPALAATPLAVYYPRVKRIFHYPQAFLGLAFSCGAPVGYAAQCASSVPWSLFPSWDVWWSGWNALDAHAWTVVGPLMAHCVLWTLAYDTVYAFQDRADDVKVGVGSAALRIGGEWRGKATLMAWSGSSACMLAMALAQSNTMHAPGSAALAAFVAHAAWQSYTLDACNPRLCDLAFRSHAWLGLVVFLGLVADRAYCNDQIVQGHRTANEAPTPREEA